MQISEDVEVQLSPKSPAGPAGDLTPVDAHEASDGDPPVSEALEALDQPEDAPPAKVASQDNLLTPKEPQEHQAELEVPPQSLSL